MLLLCSVQRQMLIVWVNGWGRDKCKQHRTGIGHPKAVLLSYWLVLTPLFLQRKKTFNLSQMSFIFWPNRQTTQRKRTKTWKFMKNNITSSICGNFLVQINGWSPLKVVQIRKLFNFGFASIKVEKERINGFLSVRVRFVKYDPI